MKLLIIRMESACAGYLGRDEQVNPLQFGEKMLQRALEVLHWLPIFWTRLLRY